MKKTKERKSNGMLLMIMKARREKKEKTNVCILVNQRIEKSRRLRLDIRQRKTKISLLPFLFLFLR
jgi:hypothetical protein